MHLIDFGTSSVANTISNTASNQLTTNCYLLQAGNALESLKTTAAGIAALTGIYFISTDFMIGTFLLMMPDY